MVFVKDVHGNIMRYERINPNTLCSHCDGKRLDCPVCGGIHVKHRKLKLFKKKIKGIYNDIKKRLVTIFSIRHP